MLHLLLPILFVCASPSDEASTLVTTQLRASRLADSATDSVIAETIAAAGIEVLEPAFEILEKREIPELEDEGPQILSQPQRQILLDTIEQLDRELVRERILAKTAGSPSLDRCHAVLYVLGRCGTAEDIALLLELAKPADDDDDDDDDEEEEEEERYPKSLGAAFESGLAGLLQRTPEAYGKLGRKLKDLPTALRVHVVLSLGQAKRADGVELLLTLFDHAPELSVASLAQAATLGASPIERVNTEFASRARDWLLNGTNNQSRTAAIFLAQLRDEPSIPYLIELLSSESVGVRDNALFALQTLANLNYPANPRLWELWYQQELDWFRKSELRIRRDLRTANDALVAAAIQDVARHRLRRDELASYLTPTLRHSKSHLRLLACRALGAIRSQAAVTSLVEVLRDTTPEVVAAAHQALKTLTGRDLACDYQVWVDEYPPQV